MGTRGFLGFIVDGEEKIAYNHMDSHPSGLDVAVMSWTGQADMHVARKAAAALRVVSDAEPPTLRDIRRLRRYTDLSVLGPVGPHDWYSLLHGTQGDPAAILACGCIEDAADFPADSLFAEWRYMVDFDAGRLEVYCGFQDKPHRRGRFAERFPTPSDGYWPVKLIADFALDTPDIEAMRALQRR